MSASGSCDWAGQRERAGQKHRRCDPPPQMQCDRAALRPINLELKSEKCCHEQKETDCRFIS